MSLAGIYLAGPFLESEGTHQTVEAAEQEWNHEGGVGLMPEIVAQPAQHRSTAGTASHEGPLHPQAKRDSNP